MRAKIFAVAAAAAVLAARAEAGDGVLEINQACATNPSAGCFPGDAPNWPVTISQSGSYRLSGNLAVPANTTAVFIAVRNVTLDLGGFEVGGPNTCAGLPVTTCTTQAGNPGIVADSSAYFIEVRNGRVYGMGGDCIQLFHSSTVDHVQVQYCGLNGISVAPHGRVSDSTSVSNYLDGISLVGGYVERSEARGNRGNGIYVLTISQPGIVIGNRSRDNGGVGITGGLASKNVAVSNGSLEVVSAASLGDNLCEGVFC